MKPCVGPGSVALRAVGLTKRYGRVAALEELEAMAGVHELAVTATLVHCQVDRAALDELRGRLHQAGIRSLTCRPPTLEELFLRHYSPQRSAAGAGR